MQPAKLGFIGETPTVKIKPIENEVIALAEWHEKMAAKNENQARKFLKTAELLRGIK